MTQEQTNFDWFVTTYDKTSPQVLEAWIIKDRTEHEAEKEAIAAGIQDEDWSMVKMDDEIQRFAEYHGQGDKEIATNLGFDETDAGFSELMIGLDFIWIEKYEVWIAENSSLYDKRDEAVIEYIKSKK